VQGPVVLAILQKPSFYRSVQHRGAQGNLMSTEGKLDLLREAWSEHKSRGSPTQGESLAQGRAKKAAAHGIGDVGARDLQPTAVTPLARLLNAAVESMSRIGMGQSPSRSAVPDQQALNIVVI
jgi:hypothetical protein